MSTLRFTALAGALALTLGSWGSAHADVLTEDFNSPFPAWESNWFGTQSTARNYYCQSSVGCSYRGDNVDGLWIMGSVDTWVAPVEVLFAAGFGASLTSFTLDVAGYSPTTLQAFDSANQLIFSEDVVLTYGAFTDPGVYSTYTVESNTGISRLTFSGGAAGNTSIDNLVAITRKGSIETVDTGGTVAAIPEPETYALMLGGLGIVGFMAKRRRRD